MKKYNVYVTYSETKTIQVEAENDEEALDKAADDVAPFQEDYEFEVEEIEE